jgi:phosphotransferase system, enzyme I, PtsP
MLGHMRRPGLSVHVHHRGDRGVDGILRLIDIAAEDLSLEPQLSAMCGEIADIAAADVVSVYVHEARPGGETLVMRGNHGFPPGAIGTVALRVGEGLTGMVAECMRPVSVAVAAETNQYKHVPGLGEERYPSFVGVPLLAAARVVGVLVMQRRRAEAFSPAEVALATALGVPVLLAIDRARTRGEETPRSARLSGLPLVPGTASGRAALVPSMAALPDGAEEIDLAPAVERLHRTVDQARERLEGCEDKDVARTIDNLSVVLADRRFRLVIESRGNAVARLHAVARDYAHIPYRVASRGQPMEAALAERAHEIEDLCILMWASATERSLLPAGWVWLTERLGAFVALCAVARGAAAVVVDGEVGSTAAVAILREGGVPTLAEVDGLFAWTRAGDRVVVDADAGTLRVNPTS